MNKYFIFFLFIFSQSVFPKIKRWPRQVQLIGPKVRVRIAKDLKLVNITGRNLTRFNHLVNEVKNYSGKKRIKFKCQNITSKSLLARPKLLASLGSRTGFVSLGKKTFDGKLHLISTKGQSRCDVINETSLESYISTLLAKEMNASWPIEALKAQAVAARTYAYHKMKSKQVSRGLGHESHYDIESSEKHQVSGNLFDATQRTLKAALDTRGLILKNPSNKITPVFYHARCGGRTLRPDQVWDNIVEGYQSVKCPGCIKKSKGKWNQSISIKKMANFLNWAHEKEYINLGKNFKRLKRKKIFLAKDFRNKSRLRVYINSDLVWVEKSLVRKYFGRFKINSNHFVMRGTNKRFYIYGKGLGHGVGMCQIGALHLAEKGMNYKQILSHYLPKHKLRKIY